MTLRQLGFRRRHLGLPVIRPLVRGLLRSGVAKMSLVSGSGLTVRHQVRVGDAVFECVVHDEEHKDPIGAFIYWRGWQNWEPAAVPLFASWAAQADRVVDVGANSGFYTLLAAALGKQVIAFEPNCDLMPFLRNNVEINNFTSCELLPFACGPESGETTFYVHTDTAVSSVLDPSDDARQVQIRKLDDCVPDDGKTCLVKIDTEGFEPDVLEGAQRLLTRTRPRIIFECLRELAQERLTSLLHKHGYRIFWIEDGGRLKAIDQIDVKAYKGGEHNFAAVHESQA